MGYNTKLKHYADQVCRYSLAHLVSGEYSKLIRFIVKKPKIILFGYPRHILIEPTLKCNINCPLCPSPLRLNPRRKIYDTMTLELLKAVVDNCKDITYRIYLTFSGEPLLNRDLHLMVRYLTDSGIMSMISTNATLLTGKRTLDLIEAGLDYLIVSFDGFSKSSFETFRKGADFEKTLANLKALNHIKLMKHSYKPYIDIQWIRTKLNEGEIVDAKRHFKKLKGINKFHVKSLSLNEHFMNEKELLENGRKFLPMKGKIRNQYRAQYNPDSSNRKCSAILSPVILANGDVSICCMDFKGEYIVGNAAKTKFSHLWRSENYVKLRKTAGKYKLPICSNCPIRFN